MKTVLVVEDDDHLRHLLCMVLGSAGLSIVEAADGIEALSQLNHMERRMGMGLRPGGFGILLVKSIVDELIYNESQNEVVFVKYLD